MAVALVVGTGCAVARPPTGSAVPGAQNPYLDRQTLRSDPAAQLRMPGADELQSVGADRRTTPDGYAPAFDGGIFGTQASALDVHAFYAGALEPDRWQPDTFAVFATSTDVRVWGWCKPERLFRLAIVDATSFSPALSQGRTYQTLFHATINGRAADVACPSH